MMAKVVFTDDFSADHKKQTRWLAGEDKPHWAERLFEEVEVRGDAPREDATCGDCRRPAPRSPRAQTGPNADASVRRLVPRPPAIEDRRGAASLSRPTAARGAMTANRKDAGAHLENRDAPGCVRVQATV
jgi:hypothetical protein